MKFRYLFPIHQNLLTFMNQLLTINNQLKKITKYYKNLL